MANGLWSLGEFAFRELLTYFEKIDTRNLKGMANFANAINVSSLNDQLLSAFTNFVSPTRLPQFTFVANTTSSSMNSFTKFAGTS